MKIIKKTKTNEFTSALLHLVGLFFSILGFIFLMLITKEHGTTLHLIGFIFFGVSLILLYAVSTIYHFFPKISRFKKTLQRLDHAIVYFFMASTYTPLCLTIDNRLCGWGLLGLVWVFALVGIIIKIKGIKIKNWVSTLMYIILGLLLLSAIGPVLQWLPKDGVAWLYGGGSFYLIGVIFFILEDYGPQKNNFGLHEIWHIFVLAGSFSHAWLMMKYVIYL